MDKTAVILGLVLINCQLKTSAIPIDNGVVGLPQVNCDDEAVSLIFTTQRPFTGRIFVKGMADKDDCVTEYRGNTGTSVRFQLGNGGCNMRRQRRLGPQRGVEQSMTVIISFHDTFITKVDRAYRCTCFFMEADKVVTSQFEVSMIPTTDLVDTARMPLCSYSVHRGSISGPIVTYAQVGEEVYHVWECDSDMFGMLVHSCFVDDGQGQNRFQLLDQNGCAIDPVILSDLTYNQQGNMAYVEAHVFKFADRVTTYFQCAVSLCMKADGACVGLAPPVCNRSNRARFRREETAALVEKVPEDHRLLALDSDLDVSAERIVVLDIDDQVPSALSIDNESVVGGAEFPSHNSYIPAGELEIEVSKQICLSPHGFGILLAIFMLILTATMLTVCIQCIRQRKVPLLKA